MLVINTKLMYLKEISCLRLCSIGSVLSFRHNKLFKRQNRRLVAGFKRKAVYFCCVRPDNFHFSLLTPAHKVDESCQWSVEKSQLWFFIIVAFWQKKKDSTRRERQRNVCCKVKTWLASIQNYESLTLSIWWCTKKST